MTYNDKKTGREDNSKNFIKFVDGYLEFYFKEKDLDISDVNYQYKIDLYSMMEI
jgi:hypothetical protein